MITIYGRPISKKNSMQIIRVRGRNVIITSKGYRQFEKGALAQLKEVKNRYHGKVNVDYTFYLKGKLDADLDNLVTSVTDVLQKSGIIDNDKNIISSTAIKYAGNNDWKTEIEINKL